MFFNILFVCLFCFYKRIHCYEPYRLFKYFAKDNQSIDCDINENNNN